MASVAEQPVIRTTGQTPTIAPARRVTARRHLVWLAGGIAMSSAVPFFRSSKLRKPVTGDLVWSAPTLATLNPIGAPIAHAGLHVAAVTPSYNTDQFLPPH